MKVKVLVSVLRAFARVDASGGHELEAYIDQLGKAWSTAMTWSVKDLLGRAMPRAPLPDATNASVAEFREALVRLQGVVGGIAKKDFNADLAELIKALEPHDKADLAAFVRACQEALEEVSTAPPADPELVNRYVERLESTHKLSDQFLPVFEELQRDKRIKQGDLARIATALAYETAPNTPKKESLRRIWLTHESYATAAAKSRFSKGRSAA
jgi:hypothetical protein